MTALGPHRSPKMKIKVFTFLTYLKVMTLAILSIASSAYTSYKWTFRICKFYSSCPDSVSKTAL